MYVLDMPGSRGRRSATTWKERREWIVCARRRQGGRHLRTCARAALADVSAVRAAATAGATASGAYDVAGVHGSALWSQTGGRSYAREPSPVLQMKRHVPRSGLIYTDYTQQIWNTVFPADIGLQFLLAFGCSARKPASSNGDEIYFGLGDFFANLFAAKDLIRF